MEFFFSSLQGSAYYELRKGVQNRWTGTAFAFSEDGVFIHGPDVPNLLVYYFGVVLLKKLSKT